MNIIVNGEKKEIAAHTTLEGLLTSLSIGNKGIAVELSGEVVPKGQHAVTILYEGDRIEIIRMVGGG